MQGSSRGNPGPWKWRHCTAHKTPSQMYSNEASLGNSFVLHYLLSYSLISIAWKNNWKPTWSCFSYCWNMISHLMIWTYTIFGTEFLFFKSVQKNERIKTFHENKGRLTFVRTERCESSCNALCCKLFFHASNYLQFLFL